MVTTVNKQASVSWSAEEPEDLQINAAITEVFTHFSEDTEPDNPHDYRASLVMLQEVTDIMEQYALEQQDPERATLAEWIRMVVREGITEIDNR